jgi:hypothetical protein
MFFRQVYTVTNFGCKQLPIKSQGFHLVIISGRIETWKQVAGTWLLKLLQLNAT